MNGQPKFSLVIPTVNQTTLVQQCIESFIKHHPKRFYEILIVEDGGTKEVQGWLSEYARANNHRIFLKPQNRGFAHTVNIGLREAKGAFLMLVNNDIVFTKPVLEELERAFVADPKMGVQGAKLLYPPGNTIQHAGVIRAPGRALFIHVNKHMQAGAGMVNISKYFPSVTGALYCMRRECYEQVGDWNEQYFLSCEDTEYSLRCWKHGWRVYYNHLVEAVHTEGKTRGANDRDKKRISLTWFLKERETIPKFSRDCIKYDLDGIDRIVAKLNGAIGKAKQRVKPARDRTAAPLQASQVMKNVKALQFGGERREGYILVERRHDAPADVICQWEKAKLPYKDGEIDEILSMHALKHISWRDIQHVLVEWNRVLKPGGAVSVTTMDLEFICRMYLEGKMTREHPDDEQYVKSYYSQKMTPCWWANIKLFAGQDADHNYHHFCLDFPTLKALLERYGFNKIERVMSQSITSPGEMCVQAYKAGKRAQPVQTVAKPIERVIVRRSGALGDVILTTPIVRRLREIHGADISIDVATNSGSVYVNNPHVSRILPAKTSFTDYQRVIDLDLAYEKTPKRHIIDSYDEVAFGSVSEWDKSIELFVTDRDRQKVTEKLLETGVEPSQAVVLHAARTWRNRTWPKEAWEMVAKKLQGRGMQVIQVGSGSDFMLEGQGIVNLQRVFSVQQLAYLISMSHCFIGNDSGLIHVAGATESRIVGLFTCAKGEYRVPWRNGEYGFNAKVIRPDVDCYGCLHNQPPPVVFADCGRGDYKCLSEITPDRVVRAVAELESLKEAV